LVIKDSKFELIGSTALCFSAFLLELLALQAREEKKALNELAADGFF
jgi:hypothetical protein